eukprot:Nitzschia sp. Nitz4//scaffold145_size56662//54863//55399//NITZ4_006566-RA/size56662-processed-gene-0.34-mRNA-1//-1//CDS//3329536604//9031//frame0
MPAKFRSRLQLQHTLSVDMSNIEQTSPASRLFLSQTSQVEVPASNTPSLVPAPSPHVPSPGSGAGVHATPARQERGPPTTPSTIMDNARQAARESFIKDDTTKEHRRTSISKDVCCNNDIATFPELKQTIYGHAVMTGLAHCVNMQFIDCYEKVGLDVLYDSRFFYTYTDVSHAHMPS